MPRFGERGGPQAWRAVVAVMVGVVAAGMASGVVARRWAGEVCSPQDAEADLSGATWAGEIPLRVVSLPPLGDRLLADGIPVPASVARFNSVASQSRGESAGR